MLVDSQTIEQAEKVFNDAITEYIAKGATLIGADVEWCPLCDGGLELAGKAESHYSTKSKVCEFFGSYFVFLLNCPKCHALFYTKSQSHFGSL
jgi:hypothetical protein